MKSPRFTRRDAVIAVILMSLALTVTILMAWFVTERLPHLEDEIAYLFQARIFARGALWAPPPPSHSAFFVPFALIVNDRWIGKYSIGWPMVLAIWERMGVGWLANPMIGALTVALIYMLGHELYDRQIGLLAGVLALTSPFFLIQSSTYMSHAAACLWATLLMWAWLRLDRAHEAGQHGYGWAVLGGFAAGMLTLTRPLSALAVLLPFVILLIGRVACHLRDALTMLRGYWPLVLVAILIAMLQPLYLAVTTGSPTTNLYTLIWPYDRLGFGPDVGPYGGHTLRQAVVTTGQDLTLWASELFGWPWTSWLPLVPGMVFGIRETRQSRRAWVFLLAGPFLALVLVHMAYWIGAQVYGPRYYYEGLAGLTILAALGLRGVVRLLISLLAGPHRSLRLSPVWPVYLLVTGLIILNAAVYLPGRIIEWHGLYNITREPLERLDILRSTDRVLIFVRGQRWIQYAAFFSLNSPWLDNPVLAAHDLDPGLTAYVRSLYPEYEIWYYSDGIFTRSPFPYEEDSEAPLENTEPGAPDRYLR